MILIVTRAWDTTANLVIDELVELGSEFIRLNTEDFPSEVKLVASFNGGRERSSLALGAGQIIDSAEITAVYYRRPDPPRIDSLVADPVAQRFASAESMSALSGFLRLSDSTWINHPRKIGEAELKLRQLSLAGKLGFNIPPTCVTNDPETAFFFYQSNPQGIVAKALRSPVVETSPPSIIYTSVVQAQGREYFDSVKFAPCIFQALVCGGFELRVTVVGHRVYAAKMSPPVGSVDWRRSDNSIAPVCSYDLEESVRDRCVSLCQSFGLHFGAIDLIVDGSGNVHFLELNPNGEWGWLSDTFDSQIAKSIAIDLVQSSL